MISTNGFSLAQPDDVGDALDAPDTGHSSQALSSDLVGPGGVFDAHFDPVFDLDGDGRNETATIFGHDSMSVASDMDGNGLVDRITEFSDTGRYRSWELIRLANGSESWEVGDSGTLHG